MDAADPELPFRLGVAFHTFTGEYCALKWSFEDLMELTAHLGGGVEITGPAHQRGYPHTTLDFERSFGSAVERYGLTPTSYGSYADPFTLPDRDRTPDELFAFTLPQLEGAARLGFPIVRLQYFAHVIAERLLDEAERLGLTLGYELHSPMTFESATAQMLIAQVERLGSPRLGLIPDCGIFARSVTRFHADRARGRGVPEPIVQQAIGLWDRGVPLAEALDELVAAGLRPDVLGAVESFWGSLGRSDPALLKTYMPHIVHMHGKFYSILDGEEPDIRYREVVSALVEGGYRGWFSSEYEGARTVNSFLLARAQQDMIRRYVAELRSPLPAA